MGIPICITLAQIATIKRLISRLVATSEATVPTCSLELRRNSHQQERVLPPTRHQPVLRYTDRAASVTPARVCYSIGCSGEQDLQPARPFNFAPEASRAAKSALYMFTYATKGCTPAPVLHVHSFNMIQAAGPSTRSEIPAVAAHDIMKLNLSPPSKHLSCPTHLACVTPGFDTRTAALQQPLARITCLDSGARVWWGTSNTPELEEQLEVEEKSKTPPAQKELDFDLIVPTPL
ncbi:hypothetical protein PPTG_24563 [Phytophthora nicotianae INRA-310]|uniref:Uncharacterized protein n=1 Tax=Phytophthora nicotianae (strain INRA-310) TaxID=761204 RepID=W2PF73_PHYN3|nr:hypothetical protein PPTG_24563 [Phytophthora nicotianae INRA-310]ETM98664.1 hypothetical protein PPTG_24563 [Phytophthora nicotianae INRA-310]